MDSRKLSLSDLTARLISLANSIGGDDEDLILQAVAALAQQAQPEDIVGESFRALHADLMVAKDRIAALEATLADASPHVEQEPICEIGCCYPGDDAKFEAVVEEVECNLQHSDDGPNKCPRCDKPAAYGGLTGTGSSIRS